MYLYKKSISKKALAAAICLALLSSTALAMPTGGKLAKGGNVSVNGEAFTSGDLESGATIKTNKTSIINWKNFSIGKGERLFVDTSYGALLNRVTGKNTSEIYGALTQYGDNAMMLVNPNGITVGDGAIINANSLIFSTLNISDADFKRGGWRLTKNSKGKAITLEKGAQLNIGDYFRAASNTITVDAGVTISGVRSTVGADGGTEKFSGYSAAVDLYAVNSRSVGSVSTNANNKLIIKGTIDQKNKPVEFQGVGGKISLKDAKISAQTFQLLAGNSGSKNDRTKTMTINATGQNKVTIDDVTLEAVSGAEIFGGTVTITGLNSTALYQNIYAGSKLSKVGNNGDGHPYYRLGATSVIPRS